MKNQLSQYLQLVKRGERVLITEHNRIIAEIALPREETGAISIEQVLDDLALSGKLKRAKRKVSVASAGEVSSGVDWISIYRENRE